MSIKLDPIFGLVAHCDEDQCGETAGTTYFTDDEKLFEAELKQDGWLVTFGDKLTFCPTHAEEYEDDE